VFRSCISFVAPDKEAFVPIHLLLLSDARSSLFICFFLGAPNPAGHRRPSCLVSPSSVSALSGFRQARRRLGLPSRPASFRVPSSSASSRVRQVHHLECNGPNSARFVPFCLCVTTRSRLFIALVSVPVFARV
uniref:Uncharacterized protein n=1 Tax=Triticum urartu TaxID=4572 RepID=A0A8R7QN83_TRIUA